MANCYDNEPINPRFDFSKKVLTINDEEGVVIRTGRNILGNIYLIRIEEPKFDRCPINCHIQERYLRSG